MFKRLKKRAIKKAITTISKNAGDKDMKQALLAMAISVLEKLGRDYIDALQVEFKDGIDAKDFLNALKKMIK